MKNESWYISLLEGIFEPGKDINFGRDLVFSLFNLKANVI